MVQGSLVSGSRQDKESVSYRPSESCSMCDYYYASSNTCKIVKGSISPNAVCDRYELKSQTKAGKDGDYYVKEYLAGIESEK